MSRSSTVVVKSHVGRDLIASAAAFRNEAAVVWEYVVNALEYVDRNTQPRVQVTISVKDRTIEISDNGRGMTRDEQRRVFVAGYSTKRRGWGLGLALARRVVEEYHAGRIGIRSSAPGEGTTIRVTLPVVGSDAL